PLPIAILITIIVVVAPGFQSPQPRFLVGEFGAVGGFFLAEPADGGDRDGEG
ncbi:MAG: hypothetical protein LQ349_002646, partial [Xanthoria aureola]